MEASEEAWVKAMSKSRYLRGVLQEKGLVADLRGVDSVGTEACGRACQAAFTDVGWWLQQLVHQSRPRKPAVNSGRWGRRQLLQIQRGASHREGMSPKSRSFRLQSAKGLPEPTATAQIHSHEHARK